MIFFVLLPFIYLALQNVFELQNPSPIQIVFLLVASASLFVNAANLIMWAMDRYYDSWLGKEKNEGAE